MTERSIERYDLSSEDGIPHLAPHATGPWVLYAQHVSTLAAQAEEIRGMREDAERYRALSDAIGDELIEVYDLRTDDEPAQFIVGSLGLEALCWYLQGEQSPTPLPARPA